MRDGRHAGFAQVTLHGFYIDPRGLHLSEQHEVVLTPLLVFPHPPPGNASGNVAISLFTAAVLLSELHEQGRPRHLQMGPTISSSFV
jgi:hypothetical protein